MYLSRNRHWASLQPSTPDGPDRLHVLRYERGEQCSLRVGDGTVAEVLAQGADA